jgi:tetratricopeptide (TPR) repeat protein
LPRFSSPTITAEPPARVDERVGPYRLLDPIGVGGMGAVYRAFDEASGRTVALKQLRSSSAGDGRRTIEALFEREYQTLVRLKHPRILEVYDYGVAEGGPYYTMELTDGGDLQQLAPLPLAVTCRHLRDVASSLALLHAHRLVHRDVTPRNVRLTADGRAKLTDFGGLTTFGTARVLVGMPACIAPESLRYQPLDQRTDLFALGVVGYWTLTGRLPYPARRLEELPALWQQPVRSPSELVAGIPPTLDALILWLLKLDPLARPASAGAVIDQLNAVAALEPEAHDHAAENYLQSSSMVGRQAEREWLQRRVARAIAGTGSEMMLEGPPGIGKTRLLHELGLEAQRKGMVLVEADAALAPGPLGIANQLALGLLLACPGVAREAARPHAGWLGHLSAELRANLEVAELAVAAPDLAERRMRLQTALREWFLAVVREQPLFIAVDNVERSDEMSATFLGALGREIQQVRLIVLLAQCSGERVAAPAALRQLRERSSQLKLAPIGVSACEELVESLFGDIANIGRVAELLHQKSAGNPRLCVDLAQLLVRKKIATHAAGLWVLPFEVSAEELPNWAGELAANRLAVLTPRARRAAEALSVERRPLGFERCMRLASGGIGPRAGHRPGSSATWAAISELVDERVLSVDAESYRFAQESVREAVLAQVEPERRSALHRRAADAMLADGDGDLATRIEAALHLLRAGDEERGANMIVEAGRNYLHEGIQGSVTEVVRALEAALEVYERGRSRCEIAGLLLVMLQLAWFADWRLIARHGDRALELGLEVTGLQLAGRLSRGLGRRAGFAFGLVSAGLRMAPHRRRGPEYDLRETIAALCGALPVMLEMRMLSLDTAAVERLCRQIAPLSLFPRDSMVWLTWNTARAYQMRSEGRLREALELLDGHRRLFQNPKLSANHGGLLFSIAILSTECFGDRALELARELEELDILVWRMSADSVRLLYHANRGESERVKQYRERVDLYATQAGTTLQNDMLWPPLLLNSDVLCGDTIAVRSRAEQLARLAKDFPSFGIHADAARAAHLMLRGDLPEAIALYEKVVPEMPPRRRVLWLNVRAWFGRALNAAGQHARARQVLSDALACSPVQDRVIVMQSLEPLRQLALAESALGDHRTAIERLDALLAAHGHEDNRLLIGLLHVARAEVAIAMADAPAFATHLAEAQQRFDATRNQALIVVWQQLAEQGARAKLTQAPGKR